MPASLQTIPTELRAKILLYSLPNIGPTTTWCHYAARRGQLFRTRKLRPKAITPESTRSRPNEYAITCVSKQIHAETQLLMHNQSFKVEILETRIEPTGPQRQVHLPDPAELEPEVPWLPIFPGLDLGKVRDFTVQLTPSDRPGMWSCTNHLTANMCTQKLLPDSPLQKFIVVLTDMVLFGWAQPRLQERRHTVTPLKAALEDYVNALKVFEEAGRLANACEVYLPYWIENHPERACLLAKWEGSIEARIIYNPFPHPGWWIDDTSATRAERAMAELAQRSISSGLCLSRLSRHEGGAARVQYTVASHEMLPVLGILQGISFCKF